MLFFCVCLHAWNIICWVWDWDDIAVAAATFTTDAICIGFLWNQYFYYYCYLLLNDTCPVFICRHFTTKQDPDFNQAVQQFFVELFPVAYHHAVHMASADTGDFHIDYKNCLMHTFDDLQPFGNIPKTLSKQLYQGIETAIIFLTGLERAADILASIEELDYNSLTPNCQKHLMKMNYCAQCNGFNRHHTKPCNGYCLNVMR